MKKLKIGVIGCGGMMNHHMNGILKFDDVEIAAVADPRPERAEAMLARCGAKKKYPSHKELFESEKKLDAVYIAVEPTAHDGIEETAIEMKLPFMVEKPMTVDLAQAKKISDAVTKAGLVTSVGFQDRYLTLVDRMICELKDMQVGMVYGSWLGGVPGVWWWMDKKTCGGQLVEQNIHLVDLLRYLFGEAESVYAACGRGLIDKSEFSSELPPYNTDDFSTALIKFKNGVIANLMSGCFIRNGNPIRNGLTIIGRDKSIEYELRANVCIYKSKSVEKYLWDADQSVAHDRAFFDAVRAKDPTAVRSPYADSYKSLELAFAANRSMETGEVVRL